MKLRFATCLFLLLSCASLGAQTEAPRRGTSTTAYKLVNISVTGTKRYQPEQIIALTGLQVGDKVGEGNFQDAVQKLGATGLFTNVSYTFAYDSAGTKLELQLTDNDKLVPAVFDNFVWYSDRELVDKIHESLPLFQGQLPTQGDLIGAVADILESLIARRGFSGAKVDVLRPGGDEEKAEAGTIASVVYSVSGVPIRIRNFDFPGADAGLLPRFQQAAKVHVGEDFDRARLTLLTSLDLRPVYLSQGKLRVQFGAAQAKVIEESPRGVLVDVSIPVTEGPIYKLAGVAWTGNQLFPAGKLDPLIHVRTGDVIDEIALQRDLDRVVGLYHGAGYMRAKLTPNFQLKDADNTATCSVQVDEGAQYQMGDLDLTGVDEKTKAKLQETWSLKPGQPYDAAYVRTFLKNTNVLLPGDAWTISVHEAINDSDKTVDVTLKFTPKA